jgi:3-hydroxyisobutyrate dehydrogenase-like beta-hydroxyacid dehydrogenase
MEQQTPIKRIGFVGVGRMGGPMALNLHRAGFAVRAYDVSPVSLQVVAQAGLEPADSLAAVVDADVVLLMLPSDDAFRELMEGDGGLLGRLRAGQIVIDMSTSMVATSQRLAVLVAERGAVLLDAPVSGGEQGAQSGTLSIMVGGDRAAFERCRPLLAAMSGVVTYIGGNGMGLIAKYVNQMLLTATSCAIAEAFALAAKANADLEAIYQAVRSGFGGSRALDLILPQLISGDMGSGRELTLTHKDGNYALAASEALGGWTPILQLSHELSTQALALGQGSHSVAAITRVYEQKMGVRLVGIANAADRDDDL